MEILEVMKSRHCVRQYTDKKIESDKRSVLIPLWLIMESFQAVRIILLLWVKRVNICLRYAVRLREYRHGFLGGMEAVMLVPTAMNQQKFINESNRIVFFAGAGVSTESGVPDFRSKDGLYNQHDIRPFGYKSYL